MTNNPSPSQSHTNHQTHINRARPHRLHSVLFAIARLQDGRFIWLLMFALSLALVGVAHFLFQVYGYMSPCEHCVYIRYAFVVMALGGLIAAINPRRIACKILGYLLGFYGACRGVFFSVKLYFIHRAAHSDDIFGVQGCSAQPHFDFGLPLHEWFPSLFLPSGDCGFDYSVIPAGVELSGFHKAFVELYTDGWYLLPQWQFGNMAECCLLAFGTALAMLSLMLTSSIFSRINFTLSSPTKHRI